MYKSRVTEGNSWWCYLIFIENHPEHLKVWNEIQNNYLLQLLDKALNSIPESEKKLGDMDNKEFGQWLQKHDFKQMQTKIII